MSATYHLFLVGPKGGLTSMGKVGGKAKAASIAKSSGLSKIFVARPDQEGAQAIIYDRRKARPPTHLVGNEDKEIKAAVAEMLDPVNSFSREYTKIPTEVLMSVSGTVKARVANKIKRGKRVVVRFPIWGGTGNYSGSFRRMETIEGKVIEWDGNTLEFASLTSGEVFRKKITPNIHVAVAIGKGETI